MFKEVSSKHLLKAFAPILVIPSGIIVFEQPTIRLFFDVRIIALQLFLLSYTMLSESTEIEASPEHPQKALLSMFVTLLGILIESSPKHPSKARLLMLVIPSGIIVFEQPTIRLFVDVSIIALQLFLLSNTILLESTDIEFSPVHSPKARFPMFVTLTGMVIDDSPMHPKKA